MSRFALEIPARKNGSTLGEAGYEQVSIDLELDRVARQSHRRSHLAPVRRGLSCFPVVSAYGVTAAPLMAAEVSSTVTGLADPDTVTDLIGSPLPTPTHLINVSVGRVMDAALDVTAPVSTNLHA
jgi:hypothetical protein